METFHEYEHHKRKIKEARTLGLFVGIGIAASNLLFNKWTGVLTVDQTVAIWITILFGIWLWETLKKV